jgi:hypothetical protein
MNEEKKLNKNYIIIAILAVIIIGGWLLFSNKTQPLTVEQELSLQEQAGAIIDTGDIKACDQIDNDMYKSVCRNNIALELAQKNLDISQCKSIENETTRESCISEIASKNAIQNKSVEECLSIKNEVSRSQCTEQYYMNIGANKSEGNNRCDDIADAAGKTLCQDTATLYSGFSSNPKNFDCSKFKSEDSVSDCNAYQQVTANQPGPVSAFCGYFKTGLFKRFCSQQSI